MKKHRKLWLLAGVVLALGRGEGGLAGGERGRIVNMCCFFPAAHGKSLAFYAFFAV